MWNWCFFFLVFFVCNNSINPCNKNKQHRLKARPTMLHIGLKRTKAASNEQTCWLQHMIPSTAGYIFTTERLHWIFTSQCRKTKNKNYES